MYFDLLSGDCLENPFFSQISELRTDKRFVQRPSSAPTFAAHLVCLLIAASAPLGAQTAVTLTPSPASLSFSYVVGSALPAAQSLAVKASVATVTAYTSSITGTNSLWLTATPDSGKMPASISVRVNPTGLAVGAYTASIVVTAGAATATVPVTLQVSSPLPTLVLSSTALSFVSPPMQPAPQIIKLTTTGGPIPFTAVASGTPWMTVTPSAGVILPGEQVSLTVSVDATSVAPAAADYLGKITITATGVPSSNKTQNITVNLTANSSTPTITSVWPPSAQVNSPATTITVRGTNFYTATVIKITGITTPLSTTVLSSTVLMAVIPQTSLAAATTLNLVAVNPAPGGSSTATAFRVLASPTVQAVVSAASNALGAVAPGELVSLYGANIGPATPATMADANNDGIVDSTLNGVSVTIDGQAAPLLYVSQNQISCQVPYAATIGTARAVLVTNAGVTATGTVDVVAAAPSIFTLDGSGAGQAAALNYNATSQTYTVNQGNNPAKLGDTVVLYITGEGDYATTLNPRTGLLVPSTLNPLPQVAPLPTVTIGGAPATVQYAGPMVGSIMGLLQVNATVPNGATTGTAVPVVVTIGGASSPAGVTMSIHQ